MVDHQESTLGESICTLLARLRSGDAVAQAELLQQLETYMSLVARKNIEPSLRPKLGASDLVQQSYVAAIEKFDQFRGHSEGELYAWVTTIIENELRQQRRAFRTQKRNVFQERGVKVDSRLHGRGADLADPKPTPFANVLGHEQAAEIDAALAKLPTELAEVIRLRNWERLRFKEIADQMNRSVNEVTRLWYRALVSLQQELDRDEK